MKSTKQPSDKRKQSFYFPQLMLEEIQKESIRQDRSLSYIIQCAWKEARKTIMSYPNTPLASSPPDDADEE